MYSVNYHRAASVAEAAKLLKNGDAKLLSGGMTLIPAMKTRLAAPSDLVDVSRLKDLQGVKVSGKTVTIGAATTHHDVANDEKLRKACPALAHLASLIGDPAVRHRGTIGGSIANNDPAADYPAALLALGATIVTNKREIAADKFFKG
ncbi:carbon monoxide dehydrogenase, partial [Mesorhizobium sp. M4A.F.Ca.ET.090.04.2.1]